MSRGRRWPHSVRARTTLAATAVVAVALAAAAIGLVWLVGDRLVAAQRDSAILRARDIAALATAGQLPAAISFPGEESGVTQVVDQAGEVLAATANLQGEPPIEQDHPSVDRVRTRIRRGLPIGDDSRFVVVSLGATTPGGSVTVYTAASLEAPDQTLQTVTLALLLGYPVLLLVVALAARSAIGRALRPVEAIRSEVADIDEHDLHRRVPEPGTGDEVDRLADTMNTMLARLDRSSRRQRQFVADASHELRSPIASLRAVLEVASAHPETATLHATVADALIDTHRLEALVTDLLTLARLDDNAQTSKHTSIDLSNICRDVLGHRGGIELRDELPDHAVIVAEELLVHRAITNLLDNACRHARHTVQLSIDRTDSTYAVNVDDDGDGVPAAHRRSIFERFTRLDSARTRDDGGTGLGLAIVAELARTLGGSVTVDDGPLGGARFTLTLPAAEPLPAGDPHTTSSAPPVT